MAIKEGFPNSNQIVNIEDAVQMCDSELHFTNDTIGFNLISSSGDCLVQFGSTLNNEGTVEYFVFDGTLPFEPKYIPLEQLKSEIDKLKTDAICERIASLIKTN